MNSHARESRRGFTLIELMIVVAVIAVVTAIGIPSLAAARRSGNEARAIGFLKMVVTVSEQYRTRYARYPSSELDFYTAGLLVENQGPGGYVLTYAPSAYSWTLQADPETVGITGDRYFFVDQTGVIRFDTSGSATAASEPID